MPTKDKRTTKQDLKNLKNTHGNMKPLVLEAHFDSSWKRYNHQVDNRFFLITENTVSSVYGGALV